VVQPDLVLLNDDDLTYAKVRLDERSLRTLVDAVAEFRDTLPRALCWAAAWDMTRDAEMAAGDYVDLVLAGIGTESDIGVVQSLLRLTRSAIDPYGDPARRDERLARLAEAELEHLLAAPPGSDHQLAWARALAASATSGEHAAFLQGLLDGSRSVDGLVVDTELRWTLLHRLVALGVAGDAEIDAELRRDDTAAGRRHALACRAARPTPAAKEEAWRLAVDSDELPNAEQAAVIGGFVQIEQRELLRPFRDRYFAVVADIWRERTSEIAQNIVVGLYPSVLAEQETVDMTDEYVRREQPTPALRRLLVEGRDGVARALRAQAKDQASARH
jgi:aminopeptidase N